MAIIDYTTAKSYLNNGLSVLPAIKSQKRPNLSSWDVYKKQLPTDKDLSVWFNNNCSGVCIVCGEVSGNLEIIDFDEKGIAFAPWTDKVKQDPMVAQLCSRLVVEQSPSGGFHVIYRCELPVAGNQKLAKTADGKTLIETRGEGGLFLCAPTEGYQLLQGDFQSIPTISAVERNILLQLARTFNSEKPKHTSAVGSFGLPISQPIDASSIRRKDDALDVSGRPGDVFNQTGDIRALLVKHGWTMAYRSDDEERWTRPGKKTGTSATLKNIDGKDYFYVFSSNAQPLESDRSYDAFGLFAALECGGDVSKASEELAKLGFGDKTQIHADINIDFSHLKINGESFGSSMQPSKKRPAMQNRRDPENFEPFPLECLPAHTKQYIEEKALSLNQDPAGLAVALLTQAGAHIGAAVKLRLGNDRFTAPILWAVYIGISGAGKSPAINGIAALANDKIEQFHNQYRKEQTEYVEEYKAFEKAKKKGETVQAPTPPDCNRVIVTDTTYEGLIKAVKGSNGRILLKVDELISFFAMTNRTKTPGEAQKWLSGYNGETVMTVRSMTQEFYIRDAYWAISGGTTPEKFRDFISAEGRDKDGTLSRFIMVWAPEQTEYLEADVDENTVDKMKSVIEKLIDFKPQIDEKRRCQVITFDDETNKAWRAWKQAIFYAKQNASTDMEVSFISKSQDLLPRIAIILHCLQSAEEAVGADQNTTMRDVETVDGITYSTPVDQSMLIPSKIAISTWNKALEITQWIRQETMSCYRQLLLISSATHDETTDKLLATIQDAGQEGVTMRDIGQKIRRFRGKTGQEKLFPILEKLIKDGIIKRKLVQNGNNKTSDGYIYAHTK